MCPFSPHLPPEIFFPTTHLHTRHRLGRKVKPARFYWSGGPLVTWKKLSAPGGNMYHGQCPGKHLEAKAKQMEWQFWWNIGLGTFFFGEISTSSFNQFQHHFPGAQGGTDAPSRRRWSKIGSERQRGLEQLFSWEVLQSATKRRNNAETTNPVLICLESFWDQYNFMFLPAD